MDTLTPRQEAEALVQHHGGWWREIYDRIADREFWTLLDSPQHHRLVAVRHEVNEIRREREAARDVSHAAAKARQTERRAARREEAR